LVVLVFVLLAADPPIVLMAIGVIYVSSGLVMTVLGRQQSKNRRSKRLARKAESSSESSEEDPKA
jgi:hypothetical protein